MWWDRNDRTVTFDTLAPGASAVITLMATANCSVANGTTLNNTAAVSAATADPNNATTRRLLRQRSQTRSGFIPRSNPFAANGGAATVSVSLPSGCAITATSTDPWITVTTVSGGTVNYTIAANIAGSVRSGAINIAGRDLTVLQGANFNDVPESNPFYTFIGKLSARLITLGCGNGNFCPDDSVTREQMAAFIVRALHERGYVPPPPAQQRFDDVPPGHLFIAY
jgi:hypothetical protein